MSDLGDLFQQTANLKVAKSLISRPRAEIGRQHGRFDFAVADGRVNQLPHVFAFDVRDVDLLEQQVQSWNFIVGRLCWEGARINGGPKPLQARNLVAIAVAYQEPTAHQSERPGDVLAAAREAW